MTPLSFTSIRVPVLVPTPKTPLDVLCGHTTLTG
jgi:hypothetical protein